MDDDIEIALERVLDGYPLLYHLACRGPEPVDPDPDGPRSEVTISGWRTPIEIMVGDRSCEGECWWEGGHLMLRNKETGDTQAFKFADIEFKFGDDSSSENITLVGNSRAWGCDAGIGNLDPPEG